MSCCHFQKPKYVSNKSPLGYIFHFQSLTKKNVRQSNDKNKAIEYKQIHIFALSLTKFCIGNEINKNKNKTEYNRKIINNTQGQRGTKQNLNTS